MEAVGGLIAFAFLVLCVVYIANPANLVHGGRR